MAQVRVTFRAMHFGARHEQASISFSLHAFTRGRLSKARPPGPRVELVAGFEKWIAAAHTRVGAGLGRRVVLAGECGLGAFLPGDPVLLGSELAAPLLFGLSDFVCHCG